MNITDMLINVYENSWCCVLVAFPSTVSYGLGTAVGTIGTDG